MSHYSITLTLPEIKEVIECLGFAFDCGYYSPESMAIYNELRRRLKSPGPLVSISNGKASDVLEKMFKSFGVKIDTVVNHNRATHPK
jgi:hypothetical protein